MNIGVSATVCMYDYNPLGYSATWASGTYLATHPTVGDEIVGTGGVRKVRYGAMGRGKSGGVRVIYYFYDEDMPIYALLIYGKNERANLTSEQRKAVKAFATAIKALRKRK
jgi:hypothetical protein